MQKILPMFAILLLLCGCVTTFWHADLTTKKTNSTAIEADECLQKYNLTGASTFFIYADWCPHCAKMKPWVEQLQRKHNVIWIDVANSSAMEIVSECLPGIVQLRLIPEFVCPRTGESKIGEFSTVNEMEDFMTKCESP